MKLDRSQYPEYPLPTKVSVQVKEDYKLLGTDIKLDRNKIYNATPATNHPDFTKYGLLFVDGVLLRREEYDFSRLAKLHTMKLCIHYLKSNFKIALSNY